MPVEESGEAHPLAIDPHQSLASAVDLTWGESTRREVVLSVKERRVEQRMTTNRRGKRVMRSEKTVVETEKTLQQEVMELTLVDESIPPAPEPASAEQPTAVLGPEDVFGTAVSEVGATEAVTTAADATATGPERPAPEPQTVPVPGLRDVLRNQAERRFSFQKEGEKRRVQYEGPSFEIRGAVYYRVDEPVASAPTLPETKSSEMGGTFEPKEKYIAFNNFTYSYPEDPLRGNR